MEMDVRKCSTVPQFVAIQQYGKWWLTHINPKAFWRALSSDEPESTKQILSFCASSFLKNFCIMFSSTLAGVFPTSTPFKTVLYVCCMLLISCRVLSTSLAHTQGAMAKAAPNRSGSNSRASEEAMANLVSPKSIHLHHQNIQLQL